MPQIVNFNTGEEARAGDSEVNGEKIVRGVVQADLGDSELRIWLPPTDAHPAIVDAARRDPADYGPEGGGGTWFPV